MMTKQPNTVTRSVGTSGFTLVELMVGIAIGLVVVLIATQFMLSNRATSSVQNNAARIEENARFAFDLISRQMRIAGFSEMRPPPNLPRSNSSENQFPSIDGTACASGATGILHMICGANDNGVNNSDELQIRYMGQSMPLSTAASDVADDGIVDCTGQSVNASTIIEERYYVRNIWNAAQNRNVPTLVCTVFRGQAAILAAAAPPTNVAMDNNTVSLVDNVERMQILYGYDDTIDSNRFANRWSPANPTAAGNMGRVRAVRVALLISGETLSTSSPADTSTYNFFGSDYANAGDAAATWADPGATLAATSPYGAAERYRLRRLFSFTTTLRNRM